MDIKYKTNKPYWFMLNNRISSGFVVGGTHNKIFDIDGKILQESTILQIQHKENKNYLDIRSEHLFESVSELLKSMDINLFQNSDPETFAWYQDISMSKSYGVGQPIIYPALKLNGEAGEVAEKIGKILRDNNGIFTPELKIEIMKELGDVLWYVTAVATDMGYNLSDVAKINVEKILDRRARKVTSGSGDNR